MKGLLNVLRWLRKWAAPARRVAYLPLWAGLAFMLLCAPRPAGAQEVELRIAYPDYWPFFSRDAKGEMAGFFYEIVTTALERLQVRAVWTEYPWTRCQYNVREGVDEAMITVPTQERSVYTVTHAHPFYRKTTSIFTHVGHPRMDEIRALRSIRDIARGGFSVITYAGNGWNDKHIRSQGITVVESFNRKTIWTMLAYERGDIIIEWPGGAWPDIRELGVADRIVQTGADLESMPFHLLIRKGSPRAALLPDFDRVIREMEEDGSLAAILDKYGMCAPSAP